MEHGNRRRWERFSYPAQLRLFAGDEHLAAELCDLSRGGMQLAVAHGCSLTLGATICGDLVGVHGSLPMSGQVQWCRTEPGMNEGRSLRVGVKFAALSEAAIDRLQLIERGVLGAPMTVQFPGAGEPQQALAMQTETGLLLKLALPALSAGAIVQLRAPGAKPQEGRIIQVELAAATSGGEPQIELRIEPCASPRKRRYLHYAGPDIPEAPRERTRTLSASMAIPKHRLHVGLLLGTLAIATAWLGARLARESRQARPQTVAHASLRPPAETHSAPDQTRSASSPRAALQPTREASAAPQPSAEFAAQVEAPRELAIAQAPASEVPPTAAQTSSPQAPAQDAPAVLTTQDASEIFVPVSGPLTGLATKLWVDPPAVVVEIPHGRVLLTQQHYDIQAEGIVGLSVGKTRGMTQLRVYVRSVLSQYTAVAAPGGVSIRLKRDLQSLRY